MTTATAPDLAALEAAAREADSRFSVHYDACPTVRIGRFCLACDDLDLIANHAEAAYRRARRDDGSGAR